jgi:hypothetical protein
MKKMQAYSYYFLIKENIQTNKTKKLTLNNHLR